MIGACHRLGKVSQLSIKHLDSLMTAFPSLLCDEELLFLLLELIELLWQSCETEYLNEVRLINLKCLCSSFFLSFLSDNLQNT